MGKIMNTRKLFLLAAMLSASVGLSGCQSAPPRGENPLAEANRYIKEGISSQRAEVQPPKEVEDALLPPVSVDTAPLEKIAEQRFDINVSEVPAREFFMGLVAGTAFNIVVHPQVTGSVSLNLKGVTIPDVMEISRNVFGYEFTRTAYGFQVLPARLRSHIYYVNYLNIVRSGASQTRVSSGQVSQTGRGASSGDGSETNTADAVTGTEINTVQPETTFWTELHASIQAILGGAPGSSVVVNPQSGVVVVRAMPQELREIGEYLDAIQDVASRQVIIEAKIVEVELNDGFQSGINWSAMLQKGSKSITASQVGGGTVFANGQSGTMGNAGNLDPSNYTPVSGTEAQAFGGVFSLALNLNDFTAFIELLETQGNVQVLSSPRVSTLNNQKAVIKVGADEFFVTDISSTTVTGTTTTTTPSVELTPFFSGIALDVTPQISAEGYVTLHVHPSVSEVEDQQKTVTVGDTTQQLPLAFSTVRESDSVVRAKSGQVIVIGGLMQNGIREEDASSPLLNMLPYVGPFLRHTRETALKTELVILLRPIVVDDSRTWAESLSGISQRLGAMRRVMREQP